MNETPWQFWVDTGGTFTDCLAIEPGGRMQRLKVLSSSSLRAEIVETLSAGRFRLQAEWLQRCRRPIDGRLLAGCVMRGAAKQSSERAPRSFEAEVIGLDPETGLVEIEIDGNGNRPQVQEEGSTLLGTKAEIVSPEEAPVLAARLLTGTPSGATLPPIAMRLATTRGTNALLERKGASCALFITQGFGDLLEIGDQTRSDLFTLEPRRPHPLTRLIVEVAERVSAQGEILAGLEPEGLFEDIEWVLAEGADSAAVALLHADVQPAHERQLGKVLAQRGFRQVALSSDLSSTIGLLARAETATVEAYLGPVVGSYLDGVRAPLADSGSILVMTSSGGLVGADGFCAKDSLLSGPAGGVVGAARAGIDAGFERILSFDMGGTSTDVARFDGEHDVLFETRVGDARLLAPSLAIETVAAGGGSICGFQHDRLSVGPESAGADPGPACYGAGGPLTITDVNLLLGRLDPERFAIPIDPEASAAALDRLLQTLRAAGQSVEPARGPSAMNRSEASESDVLLAGCLAIADERMADAIRTISLRRGYNPADYALIAFGGAGAQHACSVAELLEIRSIVVPSDAGLLSARGLGSAQVERFARRQLLAPLDTSAESTVALTGILSELDSEAITLVQRETGSGGSVSIKRRLAEMRFVGQDSTLTVDAWRSEGLLERFAESYRAVYGYEPPARPVELVTLTAVASTGAGVRQPDEAPTRGEVKRSAPTARPMDHRRAWSEGAWRDVATFDRDQLEPGAVVSGPALILEAHSAAWVEAGWQARVDESKALVLVRNRKDPRSA